MVFRLLILTLGMILPSGSHKWQHHGTSQKPDHKSCMTPLYHHPQQPHTPFASRAMFVEKQLRRLSTIALMGGSSLMTPSSLSAKDIPLMPPSSSVDRLSRLNTVPDEILQYLRPATAERPAISLLGPVGSDPAPTLPSPTIVTALIHLQTPQVRPSPSDTLVIQVWSSLPINNDDQNIVSLGGARVPISRIRFPVQVQLTLDNALVDQKDEWVDLTTRQDLYLTAIVCDCGQPGTSHHSLSASIPTNRPSICTTEPSFEGVAVSKILTQLPGLHGSSVTFGVRPPATLILHSVNTPHS